MSKASSRAGAPAVPASERVQHWGAVLSSALLHVLFLLLALWSSRINMTPPPAGGSEAGSRMAVRFIGEAPPPASPATASRPPAAPPAASPLQSTPVPRADDPVPPPSTNDAGQGQASNLAAAAPSAPAAPWRRSHTWGQPPGMLQEDLAPENAGPSRSPAIERGRSNNAAAAAEPSLQVGGYRVYYDLRSEARLRAWQAAGMTEIFMPLPGTRQYMVCPLETALKREAGPCRLLEPDSPELAAIGDAREGINMQQVYRQGEVVWRGPGPYR